MESISWNRDMSTRKITPGRSLVQIRPPHRSFLCSITSANPATIRICDFVVKEVENSPSYSEFDGDALVDNFGFALPRCTSLTRTQAL